MRTSRLTIFLIFIITCGLLVIFCSQQKSMACSFARTQSTSMTPVTIKIANTYFQIPENYLYSFMAVPAERSHLTILFPHEFSVELVKSGQIGYGCDRYRAAISSDVDFCYDIPTSGQITQNSHTLQLLTKIKSFVSYTQPITWEKDLDIANKLGLGQNPCGDETPISRDRKTKKETLTENDLTYALAHQNTQIRTAAEQLTMGKRQLIKNPFTPLGTISSHVVVFTMGLFIMFALTSPVLLLIRFLARRRYAKNASAPSQDNHDKNVSDFFCLPMKTSIFVFVTCGITIIALLILYIIDQFNSCLFYYDHHEIYELLQRIGRYTWRFLPPICCALSLRMLFIYFTPHRLAKLGKADKVFFYFSVVTYVLLLHVSGRILAASMQSGGGCFGL